MSFAMHFWQRLYCSGKLRAKSSFNILWREFLTSLWICLAVLVKQLKGCRGLVVDSPPYSPEITPTNFFLFPNLKWALKRKRFQNPDIQSHVTRVEGAKPEKDFARSFQELYSRCQKCMTNDRHYLKGI